MEVQVVLEWNVKVKLPYTVINFTKAKEVSEYATFLSQTQLKVLYVKHLKLPLNNESHMERIKIISKSIKN